MAAGEVAWDEADSTSAMEGSKRASNAKGESITVCPACGMDFKIVQKQKPGAPAGSLSPLSSP